MNEKILPIIFISIILLSCTKMATIILWTMEYSNTNPKILNYVGSVMAALALWQIVDIVIWAFGWMFKMKIVCLMAFVAGLSIVALALLYGPYYIDKISPQSNYIREYVLLMILVMLGGLMLATWGGAFFWYYR